MKRTIILIPVLFLLVISVASGVEDCPEGQQMWDDKCYECSGQLKQVGNDIKCVTCEEGFEWDGQACIPISIPFMEDSFFQTNKIGMYIDKASTFLGGGNSFIGLILLVVITIFIVAVILETLGIYYVGFGIPKDNWIRNMMVKK